MNFIPIGIKLIRGKQETQMLKKTLIAAALVLAVTGSAFAADDKSSTKKEPLNVVLQDNLNGEKPTVFITDRTPPRDLTAAQQLKKFVDPQFSSGGG